MGFGESRKRDFRGLGCGDDGGRFRLMGSPPAPEGKGAARDQESDSNTNDQDSAAGRTLGHDFMIAAKAE